FAVCGRDVLHPSDDERGAGVPHRPAVLVPRGQHRLPHSSASGDRSLFAEKPWTHPSLPSQPISPKKTLHAESISKKISIQMITLIALSCFIAMEANKQTNPKERNNNESTDSVQKNTNPTTSHRIGARRFRRVNGASGRRGASPNVRPDRDGADRAQSEPGGAIRRDHVVRQDW